MAEKTGKSTLVDGLIIPPTHIELSVVDHCNLTCRTCNHASPIMPAWFADPEVVYRDYAILAKYYRTPRFKVLGGEPLMHKHLDAVIEAARATGISEHFIVTTNGTLLHKASDAFWEAIDELEVSVYPGVPGMAENLRLAQDKARAFGKKLTVFYYDRFRATFCLHGSRDPDLVGKVYAACKIANLWGCHTVREGYLYKCPQSIYASLLAGRRPEPDGIAIVDGPGFQADLLAYLNAEVPLRSCAQCAGTVGVQESHAMQQRSDWRGHIDISLEEAVDRDWLAHCLVSQKRRDDCKAPAELVSPRFAERLSWFGNFTSPHLASWLKVGKRMARLQGEAASRATAAGDGPGPGQESGR